MSLKPPDPHLGRLKTIFSARKAQVTTSLKSGEMYVVPFLPETEEVAPFKSPTKSKRLLSLITARLITPNGQQFKGDVPPVSRAAIDEMIFGVAVEKKKAEAAAAAGRIRSSLDLLVAETPQDSFGVPMLPTLE